MMSCKGCEHSAARPLSGEVCLVNCSRRNFVTKRLGRWVVWGLLLSLTLGACGQAVPAGEGATDDGVRDFVTWYSYDEKNEDPASDERVGNAYLRETMPQFNAAFAGQWHWVNVPKAFDKMATELITAVEAAGDVPDLMQVSEQEIVPYYRNGTLQDLTAWATAQPWYGDLDPNALAACTGPDGKLYCVPVAETPQVVFVWKDRYPDGFPTTPEALLARAEELKAQGHYALTFFGSTDFEGAGFERFVWTTLSSFGGSLDDGAGNLRVNTPENIAAIEFLRALVVNDYVPEIAFAGQFQEEEAFKDASAGAFPTGIFGYRYVNPLTAPNGNRYEKRNEEDMLDAIAAGDVYLAPSVAPEGRKPGCNLGVWGFGIPTGANNPEAAKDYINWIMDEAQNAAWVLGPGGGFPALATTRADTRFQTPFYRQAAEVVAASDCRTWYGSLERRIEAQKLMMTTIYKLIKQDPTLEIAAELAAAEAEYNAGN
jgi:multiple sugar transport system substrate-binding protein